MRSTTVVVVAFCVLLAFAAGGLWRQTTVNAEAITWSNGSNRADGFGSNLSSAPDVERDDLNAIRVDDYGNEIETAIERYRVDSGGEMYELHSPETALPRLSPPVT